MSVLCSYCREAITEEQFSEHEVADLKVYKFGELDSILLAHVRCLPREEAGWEYDAKPGYKWVRNIRSRILCQIPEDTPRCCDPSTELYHAI